jgi:hypothetical protein
MQKRTGLEEDIYKLILPAGLLEHFILSEVKELCRVSDKKLFYELYLEEKNVLHNVSDRSQYESKGIYADNSTGLSTAGQGCIFSDKAQAMA